MDDQTLCAVCGLPFESGDVYTGSRDGPRFHLPGICIERLRARVAELEGLIDTPATSDFLAAVPREAAHQRKRWGADHDAVKGPADWFWLLAHLATKAHEAQRAGEAKKARHHTISSAAVLYLWHAAIGEDDRVDRDG